MREVRYEYQNLAGKPEGKKPLEGPGHVWEDFFMSTNWV
jgi:hypothetical protein